MKKKKKMWLAVAAVLELVVLLLVAAYAWIEGINKPSIGGDKMSIATATGLLMRLDGNVVETIDLNNYLKSNGKTAFLLDEASSPDGVNIYIRDGNLERMAGETSNASDVRLSASKDTDRNTRYMECTFELRAEGADRDVWFDSNCSLVLDGNSTGGDGTILSSNALRMSLVFQPQPVAADSTESAAKADTTPKTYVIAPDPTASTQAATKPAKEIDGATGVIKDTITYKTSASAEEGDLYLYKFSDFTEDAPLVRLVEDQTCVVTLRVWLEGTDPACLDEIAGKAFDLNLMFASTQDDKTDATA